MGNPHLRFDEGRVRRSHPAVTHSPTLPVQYFGRTATVRERGIPSLRTYAVAAGRGLFGPVEGFVYVWTGREVLK